MVLTIPALIAALMGVGLSIFFKPGFSALRRRRLWVLFSTGLCLGGIATAWHQGLALEHYWKRRSWERVDATIVSSTVLGKRAFRPQIIYEYEVDHRVFRDTTDMDVPGFGTKANRLNVAERTVFENSVGSTLAIIVNPDDAAESRVHVWPRFSVYIMYGVGVLAAGAFAFTGIGLARAGLPAQRGESGLIS